VSIVPANNKVVSGLFGIFLGQLGIHKFMIGATNAGLVTLILSVGGWLLAGLTCGVSLLLPAAMGILGVIEGVIYLTRTDSEFYSQYEIGHKPWL
jgi:TM2 domain-containing membrane protein YozV